jgi:hypothetical protein
MNHGSLGSGGGAWNSRGLESGPHEWAWAAVNKGDCGGFMLRVAAVPRGRDSLGANPRSSHPLNC